MRVTITKNPDEEKKRQNRQEKMSNKSRNGRKKARRRIVYGKRSQNKFSMILVGIVIAAILIVISVRGVYLQNRLEEYNEQKEELQAQIDAENERTQEIEEYAKYTQTDEFVEEVAREKLGLVRDGEIVFRNDIDNVSNSSSDQEDEEEETQDETDTSSDTSSGEDSVSEDSSEGDSTGEEDTQDTSGESSTVEETEESEVITE